MKLSLVVAQGVHAGKVVPITTNDFLIGRDPQCQLRPASPAISKQHCGISVRDGKVYVRDCGSTNGTFVNGEQVAAEREAVSGDHLKVGPLEFTLRIEAAVPNAAKSSGLSARPASKSIFGSESEIKVGSPTVIMDPETRALEAKRATTTVVESAMDSSGEMDSDSAAAMLLGMDDGPGSNAPTIEAMSTDATTVMEMPALGAKPVEEKKKDGHTDSSNAAAELLSKYMRRPRT